MYVTQSSVDKPLLDASTDEFLSNEADSAVRPVERRLASDEERCWKDDASRRS
jgi:hypothetical protein